MTLQEFCDYLIAEEDYGADMTLSGILLYLWKMGHEQIGDNMEEYQKCRSISADIYNARDLARLRKKMQVAS